MSAGIGKHQRRILAVLEETPDVLAADLARELFGGTFSAIQYANTSAALDSLVRRGFVERYEASVPDAWWPEKHRIQPAVRLPSAEAHRYEVAKAVDAAQEASASA
jgi:hypothetical protein